MNALEIHHEIERTPARLSTDTIEQILDLITMLNDRMSEVERHAATAAAVAVERAADARAGRRQGAGPAQKYG